MARPKQAKTKPKTGRPKLDIEEARVAELAYDGASNREIGAILGCDDKTVANRFSAILNKKRAERRVALRKAQNSAALSGNATLLIWLGKQELGQVDKQVTTHRNEDAPKRLTLPATDARQAEKPPG